MFRDQNDKHASPYTELYGFLRRAFSYVPIHSIRVLLQPRGLADHQSS